MLAECRYTLRRLRGQVIGWSAGVALYGVMMAFFYPSVGQMTDMMDEWIGMFPEAMLAFFDNLYTIGTPMGYLDVYFFSYLHLIIGIMAIGAGTSLLVGDEERGVLDLVLAHPVSRTGLFWGRVLALAMSLALILVAGWLSWVLPSSSVHLQLSWWQLLLPFFPLLSVLMLFAALAMLLSLLLPSARMGGMVTGALLVGNYLLLGLSNISESLQPLMQFTPLRYYQAGEAVEGLNGYWLVGLCLLTLLITGGAWLLFLGRDLRVGGERSWAWPRWQQGRRWGSGYR